MLIILVLYLSLIWLLFFKLKWLPWNKLTQWLCLIAGVVILSGFLVGLQALTPSSSDAVIAGRIVEIRPQVSGRITRINVEPMQDLNEGDILFEIDPTAYQARVDDLEARLELAVLRLGQYKRLAAKGAGSMFQLEQTTAEVAQLEAQLTSARFDLDNTVVRAPGFGMVPVVWGLRDGIQVSPLRSTLLFMDKREMWIAARFQQKALQTVKIGDTARVNFPALPGQVFETEVVGLPIAISEGQVDSSQLPSVQEQRMTRLWPIIINLPEELPESVRRAGVAAEVYIHTEGAGVVGIVAVILQWISTSMDAII